MKKRITLPIAVVAAVAAFGVAMPAAASAASCSPSAVGGEKAPALVAGGAGVHSFGNGGYSCTVAWRAITTPQYESGGNWHVDTGIAPLIHGDYAAGSGHNWTEPETDPTLSVDTPACSVRWRYEVDFINTANGNNFQSDTSPFLAATC